MLEFQTELDESKIEKITLKDKTTGEIKVFNQIAERDLVELSTNLARVTSKFDLSKLEVEYDYDTDADQERQSKNFLYDDLYHAIHFYVTDSPLKLVDNVDI